MPRQIFENTQEYQLAVAIKHNDLDNKLDRNIMSRTQKIQWGGSWNFEGGFSIFLEFVFIELELDVEETALSKDSLIMYITRNLHWYTAADNGDPCMIHSQLK
uniref:Uncharacterized protein n=1 Tax=Megaselia scalaris TaxID=36166 RepID=T1GAP5_MEGSC